MQDSPRHHSHWRRETNAGLQWLAPLGCLAVALLCFAGTYLWLAGMG